MAETRVHAALRNPPVRGRELLVGDHPVSRVLERAGGTPFYAYDRAGIERRVAALRVALPGRFALHYAIKANPFPETVKLLAGLVDGLDVASLGELRLAIGAGTEPRRISFAGPGKGEEEIEAAVADGVVLNVESDAELTRTVAAGERVGRTPCVAIRVNPPFELRASGMRMGGGSRPFGIDSEQVPAVLSRVASLGVEFMGLHVFSGSQCLNLDSLDTVWERTFALAAELLDASGLDCPTLNIGGGLGIAYFPGDEPLDLSRAGAMLAPLAEHFAAGRPSTRLVLELGRYLVGESGIYVCRVLDVKISRGERFLVTDGGMHHHLAASGNFGQVLRRNYPVCIATRMNAPTQGPATVVGRLCTPLDVLAAAMPLPAAEPGDLVAVLQSGAYGPSASPTGFLGHRPAPEIMV